MYNTFIGIVKRGDEDSLSIGIIKTSIKKVVSATFVITKAHFNSYYTESSEGKFSLDFTADLDEVSNFLYQNIEDRESTKFLVEVPKIYPYPLDNYNSAPCALLDKDSIILKLIVLLSAKGYISWMFNERPTKVLIEHIPNRPEYIAVIKYQPSFIAYNIPKTYLDFLAGNSQSTEQTAVIAALIAKNKGSYYYWTSYGAVQSAQDLVTYLKSVQKSPTSAIGSSEMYTTSKKETTKYDNIDKLTLEYFIVCKKYETLGKNDALKAALIQVCKKWELNLSCTSWRDDAQEDGGNPDANSILDEIEDSIDNRSLVYPLPAGDIWILQLI